MSGGDNNPQLVCYTRYSQSGASSRLRYYRLLPYLNQHFQAEIRPFFDDEYLWRLYRLGTKSFAAVTRAYFRRIFELPKRGELALIEYELLPRFPAMAEKLLLRHTPYVVGFDDAVWAKNGGNLRHSKYAEIARRSAGVVAGGETLATELRNYHDNVLVMPTPLVPEDFQNSTEKFATPTIVWIGTPITYKYLLAHAEVLRQMARVAEFELLVISHSDAIKISGINMRAIDWSESESAKILSRCHVGIMPLDDDAFSRGKCAYKLLQYQGVGIPAIASPVGENRRVLKHGETGFLASTAEDWVSCWKKLANSPELRAQMGATALRNAADYALEKQATRLIDWLLKLQQFKKK